MRCFLQKLPFFLKQFSTFLCGLLLFPPSPAVQLSTKDRPFLSSVVIRKGGHTILKHVELLCSMEETGLMYEVISVAFDGARRVLSSAYFKLSALARRLSISAL